MSFQTNKSLSSIIDFLHLLELVCDDVNIYFYHSYNSDIFYFISLSLLDNFIV